MIEIARQEILEELSVSVSEDQASVGTSYTLQNPKEKRKYVVFPVKVVLGSKPTIKLNEENTDFVWISRSDLEKYHILDDLPYSVDQALAAS